MCTILTPKLQMQAILIIGIAIACLKLVSSLSPFAYMALNHEVLCLGIRIVSVVSMVTSMAYELIATGRNCFPKAALVFTIRELRMTSNGTDWFPEHLNNPRSSGFIRILQILFIILSIAVSIASFNFKRRVISGRGLLLIFKFEKKVILPKSSGSVRPHVNATCTEGQSFASGSGSNYNPTQQMKSANHDKDKSVAINMVPIQSSGLTPVEENAYDDVKNIGIVTTNVKNTKTIFVDSIEDVSASRLKGITKNRQTVNESSEQTTSVLHEATPQRQQEKEREKNQAPERESVGNLMTEIASSTSATIVYNFLLLAIIVRLADYPWISLIGYSYFKAVFDTIPLFAILSKDPIFNFVLRRVGQLRSNF